MIALCTRSPVHCQAVVSFSCHSGPDVRLGITPFICEIGFLWGIHQLWFGLLFPYQEANVSTGMTSFITAPMEYLGQSCCVTSSKKKGK